MCVIFFWLSDHLIMVTSRSDVQSTSDKQQQKKEYDLPCPISSLFIMLFLIKEYIKQSL